MKARRELDALVAEKVMQDLIWDIWFELGGILRPEDPNGITYKCQSKLQAESYLKDFPDTWFPKIMNPDLVPYSTDISEAWKVVQKVIEFSRLFDFNLYVYGDNQYTETFTMDKEYHGFSDDSPAHAICIAAPKTLGV